MEVVCGNNHAVQIIEVDLVAIAEETGINQVIDRINILQATLKAMVEAVRNLVEVYAKDARKFERVGEWIERIGWPKFFELTGIEFTKYHLDDYRLAQKSFRATTQIKF